MTDIWTPITQALPPTGKPVLACYGNKVVRACWVVAKTIESSIETEIGEYDEATDAYYDPEGWYECMSNWEEYNAVVIHEGVVTHWMALPDASKQGEPG